MVLKMQFQSELSVFNAQYSIKIEIKTDQLHYFLLIDWINKTLIIFKGSFRFQTKHRLNSIVFMVRSNIKCNSILKKENTYPTGRKESSAWLIVKTESDRANPFDNNAECIWIVFSTDVKSSSGFSPGKVKDFFNKLALHIPPK